MRTVGLSILIAVAVYGTDPALAHNGQQAAEQEDASDAYIHRQMHERGFVPMAEMVFARRDVRRVQTRDPRFLLATPGIELERHDDGRLTLRIIHRDWTGRVFALTRDEWDAIAALEPARSRRCRLRRNSNGMAWCGIARAG